MLKLGNNSTNSTLGYGEMFNQKQKNPKENWELCFFNQK